jgi:hypothetical protein
MTTETTAGNNGGTQPRAPEVNVSAQASSRRNVTGVESQFKTPDRDIIRCLDSQADTAPFDLKHRNRDHSVTNLDLLLQSSG